MRKVNLHLSIKHELCSFSHWLIYPTFPCPTMLTLWVLCTFTHLSSNCVDDKWFFRVFFLICSNVIPACGLAEGLDPIYLMMNQGWDKRVDRFFLIAPDNGTVIALSQKRLVELVVPLYDNVEECILLWIRTNLPQYIFSSQPWSGGTLVQSSYGYESCVLLASAAM